MSKGPVITEQELDRLAGLFRLLSDKTRLSLLMLLAAGERNVSSLCEELSLPQPTVSHHLGLLRSNSVIASRRDGKQMIYALDRRVNIGDHSLVRIQLDHLLVEISSRK